MITLDYLISPSSPEQLRPVDLQDATEEDLRYTLFLGSVAFRIGESDFSAPWDWVPILDFALGLHHAVAQLRTDQRASFEFTESDSRVWFEHDPDGIGHQVMVSASYASAIVIVDRRKLTDAIESFRNRVIADLIQKYPPLRRNPTMQSLEDGLVPRPRST